MNPAAKIGIVSGGYLAAFLLAVAAVYLRILATANDPQAQASSGMYAFGDSVVFIFVLGFVGLIPTGFALYFLRPVRRFWTMISIAALAIALSAVGGAAAIFLEYAMLRSWALDFATMFGVERVFLTPPLGAAFFVAALFAPAKGARWALIAAAGLEFLSGGSWLLWLLAYRP